MLLEQQKELEQLLIKQVKIRYCFNSCRSSRTRKALIEARSWWCFQSIADARIAQRDQNQKLLNDLMAIGQGINRNSLAQLGSAAADATSRNNAYRSAQAASKQATYSAIGGLGSMAIMALML